MNKDLEEWLKVPDRNSYEIYNYIKVNYPEEFKKRYSENISFNNFLELLEAKGLVPEGRKKILSDILGV